MKCWLLTFGTRFRVGQSEDSLGRDGAEAAHDHEQGVQQHPGKKKSTKGKLNFESESFFGNCKRSEQFIELLTGQVGALMISGFVLFLCLPFGPSS